MSMEVVWRGVRHDKVETLWFKRERPKSPAHQRSKLEILHQTLPDLHRDCKFARLSYAANYCECEPASEITVDCRREMWVFV